MVHYFITVKWPMNGLGDPDHPVTWCTQTLESNTWGASRFYSSENIVFCFDNKDDASLFKLKYGDILVSQREVDEP